MDVDDPPSGGKDASNTNSVTIASSSGQAPISPDHASITANSTPNTSFLTAQREFHQESFAPADPVADATAYWAQNDPATAYLQARLKRPLADDPEANKQGRNGKSLRLGDTESRREIRLALTRFITLAGTTAPTILKSYLDPEDVLQARALLLSICSPAEVAGPASSPHAPDELACRLGVLLEPLVSKISLLEKSIAEVKNTRANTTPSATILKPVERTPHSTMVKSANPKPINPPRKSPPPPRPTPPASQKPSLLSDPERRLVIAPLGVPKRFPEGRISTKAVNDALSSQQCKIRVLTVQPSMAGNPVVIVEENAKAEDLLPHRDTIYNAIYGDQTDLEYTAYVDRPRHEIKINFCPTKDYNGEELPAALIWKAVQEGDSRLRDINTMCEARWIHRDRIGQGARWGTIIVSFATAEIAQAVLKAGKSVACGEMVTFERYEKCPMIKYCAWCGSLGHTTTRCQKSKCLLCASDSHPEDLPHKCINCGGTHEARSRECAKRLIKLGIHKPTKPEVGAGPKPKSQKTAAAKFTAIRAAADQETIEREGEVDWSKAPSTSWEGSPPTIKIQKRPKIKSPAKNSAPSGNANAQAMDTSG